MATQRLSMLPGLLAAWGVWLVVGVVASLLWWAHACPPTGECAGILVFLQAVDFVFGALVWLAAGLAVTDIALRKARRDAAKPEPACRYTDGRLVDVGDTVSFGKLAVGGGVVVFLHGAPTRQTPEHSKLPKVSSGFVVKMESGEMRHFPVATPGLTLVRRHNHPGEHAA